MAWIELHTRLREHPKTYALMRALNTSKAAAVGHLCCLWLWAIDNLDDGGLAPYPDEVIARAAEWHRRPGTFIRALIGCGFVDETENGRFLHDWEDYAGRLLEKKRKSRRRAEASRARTVRAACAPTLTIPSTPNPSAGQAQDLARDLAGLLGWAPPEGLLCWEREFLAMLGEANSAAEICLMMEALAAKGTLRPCRNTAAALRRRFGGCGCGEGPADG